MVDLIRASALGGYCDLVRELGGNPEPILAASNLRCDLLGSTGAFLPFRSMASVIDRAADELECPDFSLRLATRQGIQIMGPVALIARHSPTARVALEGIAQHLSNFTPAVRVVLDETPEAAIPRYLFEILVPGIPSHVQMYQLILGVSHGIFRLLMGAGFRPLLVSFPHAEPKHAEFYEKFFGCRVRFDADYAGVLLPGIDLDRHRASHDRDVLDYVTRFLNTEIPADHDLVAQVRHLIRRTISTGHANAPTVAAHLGLHSRTLQRSLAKYNETFEALLDDIRREMAAAYLAQSTLAYGRIAAMLGYSEQSCFSRASVRWFGAPPSAIRADGRADTGTARARRRRVARATAPTVSP